MKALAAIIVLCCSLPIMGQLRSEIISDGTQISDGVKEYKRGNLNKAISLLKNETKVNPKDSILWNYLGLAYQDKRKFKSSLNAFMKAIEVDSSNITFHNNAALVYLQQGNDEAAAQMATKSIKLRAKQSRGYSIRAVALEKQNKLVEAFNDSSRAIENGTRLKEVFLLRSKIGIRYINSVKTKGTYEDLSLDGAIKALENCKKVCFEVPEDLDNRLAEMRQYREVAKSLDLHKKGEDGCKPLRIRSRPTPGYTSEAEDRGITGAVHIRVVFGADSKIKAYIVTQSLPFGLTERSIKALKKMRFNPAKCGSSKKDTVKTLVFNFKGRYPGG